MTTVDVRIENEADGIRWALHNGLTGPATKLSHALFGELLAGRGEAIGPINCAEYEGRFIGRHLAQVMTSLDLTGWFYRFSTEPQEIIASIRPNAMYTVSVIEF